MTIHSYDRRVESHQRSVGIEQTRQQDRFASGYSIPELIVHRKSACPCGGGCPACLGSGIKVSQPSDAAELEADAVAERVMRMSADAASVRTTERTGSDSIDRKCASCEDEDEKENVQRKPLPGTSGATTQSAAHVSSVISSGGQALDTSTRQFFEPRLGYDLSGVRLHTGSDANASALELGARAYTVGRDIVFGAGEFDPGSDRGQHLLAHELAHVTQQNAGGEIRRMTLGTGPPPSSWVTRYRARVVPAGDLDRVNAAIEHIQHIVDNQDEYSSCIAAFAERCPGQSPTAFADRFNSAILWRGDEEGTLARGDIGGNNILYTQGGYDQGVRGLAQTLVHEMGHNCGIGDDEFHHFAEVSANYCVGPPNYLGIRLGSGFSFTNPISIVLVYRRLFDLALGGRLQATVGGDVDFAGLFQAPFEASDANPFEASEFEIASVFTGLRGRMGPWGGESFGGLTLSAEVGLDVGRFRIVRETEPDEFEFGAGFIFQSTLGAEFYVPNNPFIYNFAPEVGYRLVRPLNPEAENIHELVLGFGGMF